MYVCSWPRASTTCRNYEAVGFQPQVVDITDLGSCASPGYIFKPRNIKDACQ